MLNDIEYINEVCLEGGYPAGAAEELRAAYKKICDSPEAMETLFGYRMEYGRCAEPAGFDFTSMIAEIDLLEGKTGVHKFTAQLLNYILLSSEMKKKYEERGIDLHIYRDSMLDFKYKLNECLRLHGVVGTHVARWHRHFFMMELFALGRLQFHVISFNREAKVMGVELTPETKVINTHIPSSGPLTEELCIDAFSRAESFFKGTFPEGEPTLFVCDSWLLFPEHKTILPESSGIRRFAEMFSLVHARYAAPGFRPWPIFYGSQYSPADQLPESTSLERIYKERYMKGLPSGSGVGVILFKDGKILNTERSKMV